MVKRIIIGLAVLGLLFGGYWTLLRPNVVEASVSPELDPVSAPVEASSSIIAEARVVPAQSAALSMATPGVVSEIVAGKGQRVEAGEVVLRLDTARLEVALAEAEAGLAVAEANLRRAQADLSAEDVAALEAGVDVARAGVQSARGAVAGAEANLLRVRDGASVEDMAVAEGRVEQARNALWGAQSRRDGICGRVGVAAQQADCDSAQAAVQQAEEEVRIAELQRQAMGAGAREQDVAAAQAQVEQARGQLATAQAQVRKAEADAARAGVGASIEDVVVAEAQVEQARVAVNRARLALTEAELRAPFGGTVVALDVQVGELVGVGTPIVRLADLSAWQIETTDLSELNIVRVREGMPVTITFDAIPSTEMAGHIVRIDGLGTMNRGEIAYTAVIEPDQQDARLRWNMTATVVIPADAR